MTNLIENIMGSKGKLEAMINLRDVVILHNGIQFRFSGCKHVNIVQILVQGDDLYSMVYYKHTNRSGATLAHINKNVFAENVKAMFADYTGLRLAL